MSKTVLILGAKGRFGRAALTAFKKENWNIRAFVRAVPADQTQSAVEYFEGDALSAKSILRAAHGVDVIVNALNPPYPLWRRDLPGLTRNVIDAAKTSGATIMIPGNVYNYGANMPMTLTEDTPHNATAKKGKLRVDMERSYSEAAIEGVQTIILRGGDFIEREQSGNWFDSQITNKISTNKIMYPGPQDQVHAWAYLPDMARALVGLAGCRQQLSQFEEFGFEGYSLTGQELVDTLENIHGQSLKVSNAPWSIVRLIGIFNAQMREVLEMRYLWNIPHQIDGSKLSRTLPNLKATRLETALADATYHQTTATTESIVTA